jgi:hypothetical protein
MRIKRRANLIPLGVFTSMATNRTSDYIQNFAAFLLLVAAAAGKALNATDTIDVYPMTGRVFDRVMLRRQGRGKGNEEVLFFVRISDGQIFGPKSSIAPNLKWWYGDLASTDQWNFADPFDPKPKAKFLPQYRAAFTYGGRTFYVRKGMHKTLDERRTPLVK